MAQIVKGETFATGESVTAARLNALADDAELLPGAITEQGTATAAAGDSVLVSDVSSAGALYKATITEVLALQLADQAAGTASMRTLGSGATQAAAGSVAALKSSSNVFTGTLQKFRHVGGTTGVTIAANAGLGTGSPAATLATGSSDMCGIIQLVPGTTPTTGSSQCTITFGVAHSATPFIMIGGYNSNAALSQQGTKVLTVTGESATVFDLLSGASALVTGTTYKYWYIVFNPGS